MHKYAPSSNWMIFLSRDRGENWKPPPSQATSVIQVPPSFPAFCWVQKIPTCGLHNFTHLHRLQKCSHPRIHQSKLSWKRGSMLHKNISRKWTLSLNPKSWMKSESSNYSDFWLTTWKFIFCEPSNFRTFRWPKNQRLCFWALVELLKTLQPVDSTMK